MKKQRILTGCLTLGVACSLFLTGCEPAGGDKVSVGKVDTAMLLQDDPEYQSISIEYLKEQTDLRGKYIKMVREAQTKEGREKVLIEQKKASIAFNEKWSKTTKGFLESRHNDIAKHAETIAKRKKIDMVIVDSREYATVEWGGVDMTKDVSLLMSQAGSKPSSDKSPAAEK